MSIINEALKKTQTGIQKNETLPQPLKKNPTLWVATVLIFLGFLGCGTIFAFIMFSRNQAAPTASTGNNDSDNKETAKKGSITLFPSAAPNSAQAQNSADALVLNGIITMGTDRLALINNQILKEGDYIGEKRVLSIEIDKVEIFDKGQVVVLKTQ
ncbi:MAG TPA: hypothetical protein PL155_06370 [Candidatus Omnitrophota bacterium]|nr:hypothetical protein [Candidatus Omnitrophota bacterium]HPD83897.1 hypothetical protein [Candidatus Omnitrophota bacterium]HRZ02754.1 hypothetical protein [Candidatus Omnitrophota bacterium]